jgi:CrcB protein
MGAFTTFSTYMFETGQLARSAEWWHAAANLVGQPVVGMGALLLGFAVARLV